MDTSNRRPLDRSGFEIAIICALPLETHAVLCSLDEIWHEAGQHYRKAVGDCNAYDYGRIGVHSVVVLTLGGMGKVKASTAAQSLKMSFSSIKLALLVGICGGVPFKSDGSEMILGDVILSESIVEFDFGRRYHGHLVSKNTILDVHGRPNEEILGLLQRWKVPSLLAHLRERSWQHLKSLLEHPLVQTVYPGQEEDKLFPANYIHQHHSHCVDCDAIGSGCSRARDASCVDLHCDERRLISRRRLNTELFLQHGLIPGIHFGPIGTSDSVMKSAQDRDEYAQSRGIIAFEMEGAGVWNKFNSLIIKGVCDYSDSHKNKKWQDYAAAVAASVAKEVLSQYVLAQKPQTEAPNSEI